MAGRRLLLTRNRSSAGVRQPGGGGGGAPGDSAVTYDLALSECVDKASSCVIIIQAGGNLRSRPESRYQDGGLEELFPARILVPAHIPDPGTLKVHRVQVRDLKPELRRVVSCNKRAELLKLLWGTKF